MFIHHVCAFALLVLAVAIPAAKSQDDDRDEFLYGQFPDDFEWGFATAAYQIEGAWNESGKGPNIWDDWTHKVPSEIDDKSTGDIACDSYNKWEQDVALLKNIGAKAYRFSLSWARIFPDGTNATVNPEGVEYYNNLIDKLVEEGIAPMITLYHWDLPSGLMRPYGWVEEEIIQDFVNFADFAFKTYGDRVKKWITFNEPWVVCYQGYQTGDKAPAIVDDVSRVYQCAHNIIKSHAKAYNLYQAEYKSTQGGVVGITLDCTWLEPKNSSDPTHVEASERGLMFKHGWWAFPIYFGDYPDVMKTYIANASSEEGLTQSRLPEFTAEEKLEIQGTTDFIGLNHYTTNLVEPMENPTPGWLGDQDVLSTFDDSWPYSSASWLRVVPWGFRKMLTWLKNTYNNPIIYVTENGFADYSGSGVDDVQRVKYYNDYINEMLKAIRIDGANVTSYTAWSLMDNFEWRRGYTQRFGAHYVDFADPARPRTPKASANRLKQIFADNGFPQPETSPPTDSSTSSSSSSTENAEPEATTAATNKIHVNFVVVAMLFLYAVLAVFV